jgi:drug/metabolite transporter (DMT)-like permease
VSTTLVNVGAVLQKREVDRLPDFEHTPLLQSLRGVLGAPLWVLGWLVTTVAVVLNMIALGLADISVIQPLNGFGLVVLALLSRFYLGERIDVRAIVGMGLIFGGVVVVGLVLPDSHVFGVPEELVSCFLGPRALVTLGLGVLLLGLGSVLSRFWRRAAGILLAFVAAVGSVLSFTFSKGLFGILNLLGVAGAAGMWACWVLLALVLIFSTAALALQQASFQRGEAIVVTPVFGASSVVLPLITGRLVFGETLPSFVLLAPLLIAAGVLMLGLRQGAPVRGAGEGA